MVFEVFLEFFLMISQIESEFFMDNFEFKDKENLTQKTGYFRIFLMVYKV